jgi:hypothetical protein
VQAWHGGACLQSSFQEAGAGGLIMSVKPVKKKRERESGRERGHWGLPQTSYQLDLLPPFP